MRQEAAGAEEGGQMNYLLRCVQCGATQWVSGTFEDPETGAVDLADEDDAKWTGGDCGCQHEDWDVIDSEHDQHD